MWCLTGELVQQRNRAGYRRPDAKPPAQLLSRKVISDLPSELSAEVRLFLIWLVLVLWKRAP